jgi:hypothetical protein
MEPLTPKNVFIIKLRVHASPYYLKLWHGGGPRSRIGHLKHIEACDNYFKFFEKLYEHVTNEKYDDLFYKYGFGMGDCAKEILHSDYQILQFEGGDYKTFVFNKNNTELIKFFMDNIENISYKILKRSRYWMHYSRPQTTYMRDIFKKKITNENI